MKVAPVMRALARRSSVTQTLVHTGQHYDANMSDVFFRQLEIPAPDVNLAVGSDTHARQTAEIMVRLEPVLLERPDLVLVYGDVNSTVAATLTCAKLQLPVGHVEAGLRSFDRSMPEEINRLVTDQLSTHLFTPSPDADTNLNREGIAPENIHRVGNVMIDSLVRLLPVVMACKTPVEISGPYALLTLHRPSNVDDSSILKSILTVLEEASHELEIVFPVHPRTRQRIAQFGLNAGHLRLLDPLPYFDFLALQRNAAVVITDSGGIQEETTYLGIPCLTLRQNTERPVTVTQGTNVLVGQDPDRLRTELQKILSGKAKKGIIPDLWDGKAGERIATILAGN